VVNAAESYVSSNTTETEIVKYANEVCGMLGQYSTLCTMFVNAELIKELDAIIAKETPAVSARKERRGGMGRDGERKGESGCVRVGAGGTFVLNARTT